MKLTERKWFYPLVYFLLVCIAFLPLQTEKPYAYADTRWVIDEILRTATQPYAAWSWVFHAATVGVIAFAVWKPRWGSRAVAAYFGLNYLAIAVMQTRAQTASYGFAVHTGAMVAGVLLGALWLWVAWADSFRLTWERVPAWRWALLPLALLAFWTPVAFHGSRAMFHFSPLLLLTSDYGLAYCLTTPVLLFLIILAWPQVDGFALRVTAFNATLYGLFNLPLFADPNTVVMGVMHVPLLALGLVALLLPRLAPPRSTRTHMRPHITPQASA